MDHESLLLGEMREFKRATLDRLSHIERKVDSFQAFRAKVIGLASLAAFVASTLATVAVEYFRMK